MLVVTLNSIFFPDHALEFLVHCSLILLLFIYQSSMFCMPIQSKGQEPHPKSSVVCLLPSAWFWWDSSLLVSIWMTPPFSRTQFPPAWLSPILPLHFPILLLNFWLVPKYCYYHHCCYKHGFSDTCAQSIKYQRTELLYHRICVSLIS